MSILIKLSSISPSFFNIFKTKARICFGHDIEITALKEQSVGNQGVKTWMKTGIIVNWSESRTSPTCITTAIPECLSSSLALSLKTSQICLVSQSRRPSLKPFQQAFLNHSGNVDKPVPWRHFKPKFFSVAFHLRYPRVLSIFFRSAVNNLCRTPQFRVQKFFIPYIF